MFAVVATFPLGAGWEETDARLAEAAGRRSDYSEATAGRREHRWVETLLSVAVEIRKRLELIPGVTARVRES